jgi:hemolysin activation/secretion protein
MKNVSILAVVFLAAGHTAWAQPAVGAGGLFQQIPPEPTPPKSLPDIRIDRGRAPSLAGPPGPQIVVKALHVTGETRFTEAALIAQTGFQPGAKLDLAGLRTLAQRITDFYGHHGYFLTEAYIPAQDIANGSVTIAVVEGRYGKIALDNRAHVIDSVPRSILKGLAPGDVVEAPPLERRLLLLSDLPAVAVKATLAPGADVGTSDLLVDLTRGPRIDGILEADNAGNPYTGEYRGGGTINFNEPFGLGDKASLRVLTSGSGLNYERASYEARIQDMTVGVAYAHLGYRLGRQYTPLDAIGDYDTASLYASYPLIRSPNANLYVLADVDARTFRDQIKSIDSTTDKSATVGSLGLAGDSRDHLWGGGSNVYSAYVTVGGLDIRTPLARSIDAVTARTQGSYSKLWIDASRLQNLGGPFTLYGEARGQMASKNLDPSEKMELGGAYGVRAYPEGEAYGDQGYILTAELRMRLPTPETLGGRLEAAVFADNGWISADRSPWAAGGGNDRTLSAAGVGLTWYGRQGLMLKASYAFKLGDAPALSAPDRAGRLWIQLSQTF